MSSPPSPDPAATRVVVPVRPFSARAVLILWPSFVMSGVLEALIFVVVDPTSLHWFGLEPLNWSSNAVYSATFLIIWLVMSTSGAITHLLEGPGPGPNR
ncbi:MAG: hypothetical protein ABI702_21160 [Burkholderiales bacterium]